MNILSIALINCYCWLCCSSPIPQPFPEQNPRALWLLLRLWLPFPSLLLWSIRIPTSNELYWSLLSQFIWSFPQPSKLFPWQILAFLQEAYQLKVCFTYLSSCLRPHSAVILIRLRLRVYDSTSWLSMQFSSWCWPVAVHKLWEIYQNFNFLLFRVVPLRLLTIGPKWRFWFLLPMRTLWIRLRSLGRERWRERGLPTADWSCHIEGSASWPPVEKVSEISRWQDYHLPLIANNYDITLKKPNILIKCPIEGFGPFEKNIF